MNHSLASRIAQISIPPSATIRQAMQAIEAGALGTALIVEPESGRFRGLVTDGDIRRALLRGAGLEGAMCEIARPTSRVARTSMSPVQITAMFDEAIRLIPVLNDADHVVDLAIYDRRAHLPVAQPVLGEKELVNVTECILSGWISSTGRFVAEFERACAAACGTEHAVSTANGTVALHLALLALGVGPGDEVIVPTLTFIASANAVTYTGARPVFVDSEPRSWNIDPQAVARAITPRTKAVMVVHLYGHPCDMEAIAAICRPHGVALVEDAAEAFGSTYRGRPVGSLSDIATFSFFGNKIITTGEGGMITTTRRELAERCRLLRDHGMSPERRYWHTVLGYNYRMTNLQAAVGVAQVEKLEAIIAAKRRIAATYRLALRGLPGVDFPDEPAGTRSVFWLISVTIAPGAFGIGRDAVMARLKAQGIETRPVFPVVHRQPIYPGPHAPMPVADEVSDRGLSLPSDATLTEAEILRVAGALRALHDEAGHDVKNYST